MQSPDLTSPSPSLCEWLFVCGTDLGWLILVPAAHLWLLGWLSSSALRAQMPVQKIACGGEALLEEQEPEFKAEMEELAACREAARLELQLMSSSELEA